MNTKIVYVATSSLNDIFWEQMWVSVWSLKHHNPACHVVLVTDEETYGVAKNSYRASSLDLIDEVLPYAFEKDYPQKKRSRFLKLKLRQLISGNFLYIDSDTVVTADMSEIDTWDIHLGLVYDQHENPRPMPMNIKGYQKLYGVELSRTDHYYNGGLIFAKDDEVARDFFERWYSNWTKAGNLFDYRDQPPLAQTVLEMGNPVTPLSGIYNCQVLTGVRYLHEAKIIHFFNNPWVLPTQVHPLLNKETYRSVVAEKGLSDELIHLVLNCKSEFYSISFPVGIEGAFFLRSYIVRVLYNLYEHKRGLFKCIDKVAKILRDTFYYLKYKSFLRHFRS